MTAIPGIPGAGDTVVVLDTYTGFGISSRLLAKLANAFVECGLGVLYVQQGEQAAADKIEFALRNRSRIAFAICAPFGFFKFGEAYFHRALDVPIVTVLIDHPAFKAGFVPFNNSLVVTANRNEWRRF